MIPGVRDDALGLARRPVRGDARVRVGRADGLRRASTSARSSAWSSCRARPRSRACCASTRRSIRSCAWPSPATARSTSCASSPSAGSSRGSRRSRASRRPRCAAGSTRRSRSRPTRTGWPRSGLTLGRSGAGARAPRTSTGPAARSRTGARSTWSARCTSSTTWTRSGARSCARRRARPGAGRGRGHGAPRPPRPRRDHPARRARDGRDRPPPRGLGQHDRGGRGRSARSSTRLARARSARATWL